MRLYGNIRGIIRNHPDHSYSGQPAVLLAYPAIQSGARQETVRPLPNTVRDGSKSVGGIGLVPNRLPRKSWFETRFEFEREMNAAKLDRPRPETLAMPA